MSFLSSMFGGGPTLGVDIGTTTIKIAEVVREKEKIKLANYGIFETYGYLERFNEALQTSSLKLAEKNASNYIKFVVERMGSKVKNVIASVPAFSAFSTLIEVPEMNAGELKKFMELQAKQYVPMPLENVALDWMKVGERTDNNGSLKHQIFLVSVPKEQLASYQQIFKNADLKLSGIEIEGMAFARSTSLDLKDPAFFIDIGSRSTSFGIVQKGFFKFGGQTDFASGSITQAIASGLNIGQKRAEDLKKQRGLLGYGGEHELSTLIEPILDVIISEAKRVLEAYQSNYQEKATAVFLAGGGSHLLGIEDYFSKRFDLPVTKANALQSVSYPNTLAPLIPNIGPVLGVAIGLGIKNLV